MKPALVDWQLEDGPYVMPWWTHPFLDELRQWKIKHANWLEFGGGRSTAWLRSRCGWVDTIETNYNWAQTAIDECNELQLGNGRVIVINLNDGQPDHLPIYVDQIPDDRDYEIISVDGIFRTEIVEWAIDYFQKRNGGVIIMDNLDQDFVWISPRVMEALSPFELTRYFQPDHIAHEGKPWNTSVVYIPKK